MSSFIADWVLSGMFKLVWRPRWNSPLCPPPLGFQCLRCGKRPEHTFGGVLMPPLEGSRGRSLTGWVRMTPSTTPPPSGGSPEDSGRRPELLSKASYGGSLHVFIVSSSGTLVQQPGWIDYHRGQMRRRKKSYTHVCIYISVCLSVCHTCTVDIDVENMQT